METILHERHGQPVARVLGMGRGTRNKVRLPDFAADPEGLFTVGVAHGSIDMELIDQRHIPYMALGGQHSRRTLAGAPKIVQYAGTHQGRSPNEEGQHGATVVDVDETGRMRTRLVPCDVLRYVSERVVVEPRTTREELESQLRNRVQAAADAAGGRDVFISFQIAGQGRLTTQLRHGGLGTELIAQLRADFGMQTPAIWTVKIASEPNGVLPAEWYGEETIMGDFLRLVRDYQSNAELPLNVDSMLSEQHLTSAIRSAVAIKDLSLREHILTQVAQLGSDMLGGEAAAREETHA